MSDNEIIKALEICFDGIPRCGECPYTKTNRDYLQCTEFVFKDALKLINRQKAEVERLKADKEALINAQITLQEKLPGVLKSEARKEFWEQIKEMYGLDENDIIVAVNIKEIDNLLEEMEERK